MSDEEAMQEFGPLGATICPHRAREVGNALQVSITDNEEIVFSEIAG